MKKTKIAIIGSGRVGSTAAYTLILKNISAEIMLVDIDKARCKGEALDLSDAATLFTAPTVITGSAQQAGQADIIIITAGAAQKPSQTRAELFGVNKKIITSIIDKIKPINPNAIILMITNPVDALTLVAQELSGLPRTQVFGSGTFLDSQRLSEQLAKKLHIAEQSIHAYVLGEHGDEQFVAWSRAQVAGVPILDFPEINRQDLDKLAEKTRTKVYEIISCKGATYYGIASVIAALCENIIFDQKRIAPVSCYIESLGVYLSMPTVLGAKGVEQIIPIPLDEGEKKELKEAAEKLKGFQQL